MFYISIIISCIWFWASVFIFVTINFSVIDIWIYFWKIFRESCILLMFFYFPYLLDLCPKLLINYSCYCYFVLALGTKPVSLTLKNQFFIFFLFCFYISSSLACLSKKRRILCFRINRFWPWANLEIIKKISKHFDIKLEYKGNMQSRSIHFFIYSELNRIFIFFLDLVFYCSMHSVVRCLFFNCCWMMQIVCALMCTITCRNCCHSLFCFWFGL